jgi:hypothetical protein
MRAPVPDFRCITLEPYRRERVDLIAAISSAIAVTVASLPVFGGKQAALGGATTLTTLTAWAWLRRSGDALAISATPTAMTLTPWGVVVEGAAAQRALRWSAVRAVHYETRHRASVGESKALYSVVVVETEAGEALCGRTVAEVALEQLVNYLPNYRQEQEAALATDLESARTADDLQSLLRCADAQTMRFDAYRSPCCSPRVLTTGDSAPRCCRSHRRRIL